MLFDGQGRCLKTNRMGLSIMGRDESEVIGKKMEELFPGAYRLDIEKAIEKVLTGEQCLFETRQISQGGSTITWNAVLNPINNEAGKTERFVGIFADVTRSKQAEEALLEQKNFSATLIRNSATATFVLDREHRIMIWNRACEELTGCPESEMIGTDNQWKPFYSHKRPTVADVIIDGGSDSLPELYKVHSRSALNPHGIRAEGWYRDLGGRDRYIMFEASPINNSRGDLIAVIETLQDITEGKRLEEHILQVQKIESIGRLAGGVAHDFNNMLSAIIGYSEIVLSEMDPLDPLRDQVGIILEASEKAAALTHQLLAFSRKQLLKMEQVNFNEVVSNLSKMLVRIIGEDISLRLHLKSRQNTITADPGQLEQVLLNLAVNARDAMPHGGSLVIETMDFEVQNGQRKVSEGMLPGRYVMLSVSDTGEGMTKEVQDHLFEPFFTTKEVGKGTGLGLATVYGIVKQHNGFTYVYSERGKGSTFKIYLPVAQAKEDGRVKDMLNMLAPGKETVLIVDDDSLVRRLVVDILKPLGYTVIEASGGKEAITIINSFHGNIDIMLTDIIMPEMNGRQLVEVFLSQRPGKKVIFMSGYTDEALGEHQMLDKGIIFIEKPITPSKLSSKIRGVLDA